MNTEILAVRYLELTIARNDYLVPHINTGDREPSWDGDIEVYRKPGRIHSKDDLILKVPIQVKGHVVPHLPRKRSVFYPIATSDLRNYLNAGGSMFFVVYVNENGTANQIFYTSLLPFELKRTLSKCEKHKTKNLPLTVFPQDNSSIANVLLNCARDMKKQRPAVTADIVTCEDLIQAGYVPDLSLGYIQVPTGSPVPFEYMFEHGTYLYAKLPFGIELPVERIDEMDAAYTEIEAPVSINNQIFYDKYRVIYRKDYLELCFGESSRFLHYYNSKRSKLCFHLAGTLSERITDEAFIIEALSAGGFDVKAIKQSLRGIPTGVLQQFDVPRKQKHLNWLRSIKETLDRLSVTVDLNCTTLSSEDEGKLRVLKESVLDKKPIQLHDISNHLCRFTVSNLSIIIYLQEVDAEKNLYQIINFNHAPTSVTTKDRNGMKVPSSLYVVLKSDVLLQASNIDYQEMLRQIKQIPLSEVFSAQLTNLLLEMLTAYDDSKDKREDIIAAAIELAEWLRYEDTFCSATLNLINHLQSIKRTRKLNNDECHQLNELIERGNDLTEQLYVGIYLLLDQQVAAQTHFVKMESSEQKQFLHYPISRFLMDIDTDMLKICL